MPQLMTYRSIGECLEQARKAIGLGMPDIARFWADQAFVQCILAVRIARQARELGRC